MHQYCRTSMSLSRRPRLRVCVIVFGLASIFYLLRSYWQGRPSNRRLISGARHGHVVDFSNLADNLQVHPDERYLAYLPHSGFHNQRIAFENALLLSRMLNRTLLVPPIRLGNGVIRYFPFNRLYNLVALSGKENTRHCNSPQEWQTLPVDCYDHFDYTLIPWNWMVDLSLVERQQNLLYRWDASDAWLREALKISSNDTFTLKDSSPLQYRFLDADPLDSPGNRYKEAVAISLLAQVPHRLLQLGTLFGSSRLRLRRRKNIQMRKEIRESMVFTNSILIKIADNIASSLGGSYLAAHIRLGDGKFVHRRDKTIKDIWWKLVHEVLGFQREEASSLEARMLNSSSVRHYPPTEALAATEPERMALLSAISNSSRRPSCQGTLYNDSSLVLLNTPLFISTDATNPRSDPSLHIFLKTFPCTFFLSEFTEELAPLEQLTNGYDGLSLKGFMLPFLDSIVASKSYELAGTEGSTFSQFTHDVLWRCYHGWEIIQRG